MFAHTALVKDFNVKIVDFEKTNNKDREIHNDTFQILYGQVKNGVRKIGIHRLQSLEKVIGVVFFENAKNSEHGDTKLVVSESTQTIIATTQTEEKVLKIH